jgi:hypothetical protein
MSLTRKDYDRAAEMLLNSPAGVGEKNVIASFLCVYFRADNVRFDEVRFRKACGLTTLVARGQ